MTHSFAWRAATLSFALVATYGCAGGLSCGGSSGCSSTYAFPQTQGTVVNGAEIVEDGVRLRMTQDALDFLAGNIGPLLAGALNADPSNPDIVISRTDRVDLFAGFSLGQGGVETHPYEISIDGQALTDGMVLEFVGDDVGEPEGIRVRVADVPVGIDARVFFQALTETVACDLFGTNPGLQGRPWFTTLSLEMIVTPRVGLGGECDPGVPECLKIDVDVTNVSVGGFGAADLGVERPPVSACADDGLGPCSEECSDTVLIIDGNGDNECIVGCALGGLLVDVATGLFGIVNNVITGFLPGILEGAVRNAFADIDGAPLAASGRLSLSGFAPGVVPDQALDMGFAVGPTTGAFDVNDSAGVSGAQGMDLIFKSGFEAAPPLDVADDTTVPHPCVRPLEGNDFANLYGALAFEAPNAEPLSGVFEGQTYHVGASLAQGALNQALFAAYNSGALCIEASTESIHVLTGGSFALSAGTLDLLTDGKLRELARPDAPAIIALAPSQPPLLTYGSGSEDEGHLIVSWPSVEISFYVMMNERFARVFAVSTDISLQLTVFNDPETQTLRIAVVDGPNIENFVENYNELLPGVAFTEVLESLIGVAFDAALGDGLAFNFDVGTILSTALGGAPVFVDFRGIETVPPADRQFLNVYFGLTSTPPQPVIASVRSMRVASDAGVMKSVASGAPNASIESVKVTTTGEVHFESADMPFDGNEYFARVDFGAWRGPLRSDALGVLVVKDPKLRLVGEHTILLRARVIGDPGSLAPIDAAESFKVWVDPEAPRVALTQVGDRLVARGWDIGSPVEDLVWQWQLDDGAWSVASDVSSRSVFEVDARRVAVRAIDGAGNVSKSAGIDVVLARKRVDEEAKMSRGCAQVGNDGPWLAGVLLVGALGLRSRRRRG